MDADRRAGGEELHEQREWLRVTLACVGDAVITTDADGGITQINPAAQELTGWTSAEAAGVPLEAVFRIIDEESRTPVEGPAARALREGLAVGMSNHSLFVARDGTERLIDHSAAPIRNGAAEIAGVVLVFRDITERRRHEHEAHDAFRKWHRRKRDDAVAEMIGKMRDQWSRLLMRGKNPEPMIGPLIHWAKMWVRYDRKIAGRGRNPDVFDYRAGMTRHDMDCQGRAHPAERSNPINGWLDWAVDAGANDPAELAAALDVFGLTSADLAA